LADIARQHVMNDEIKDLALHYRELAAAARASADAMTYESVRQGMLAAANVWDQLADLVERSADRG
jgi:hypothetical protein